MEMSFAQFVSNYLFKPGYFAAAFITALIVGVCLLKSLIYRRLLDKFEAPKYWWPYSFFTATSIPFTLWIITSGITWMIQIHGDQFSVESNSMIMARQGLVLLFGTWAIFKFVGVVGERYVTAHPSADKALIFAMAQITRLVILVLAILILMELYQIPISGVLAFGGVGAAAIAFASKDLLGNFFGGLMIFLDQPFKLGDWIRSPDKSIEGTVEYIGWRLTRIRTFDKRPLYVPNGIFSNIIVENPSRMHKRRLDVSLGLRYDDAPKLKAIIADLRLLIENNEYVDKKEQYYVYFNQFGSSSLNILIRAHMNTTVYKRFLELQENLFFEIIEIIDKHGAECAFPTTTLHIPNPVQTEVVS